MIEFRKFTEFPRGTLYNILQDAYSFDTRNKEIWDENWHESDDFFYDNPKIADNYGLVTCIDGEPIGFVTWDPRHRPDYVEIGHNGIREKYKGNGYGRMQLQVIGLQRMVRVLIWAISGKTKMRVLLKK